ncbi:MAG TPA: VOC family protein [Porticoccaceae bacterium]|jgi:catechol 2,3-dioxygenase-like lactoylglutathione lyase family enzyme|nr:VOC family protein [Pseudomonadota bacterium]HLS97352.1 VOC family protein [Porticoccaceae bacterium]
MIRGAHHVAISTPNLERALGFYRDLMGFREIQRGSWEPGIPQFDQVLGLTDCSATQVMLRGANLCIELFEFKTPEPAPMDPNRPVCNHGHTHICFDVVNIHEVYDRLVAAGIRFHAPPQDFGAIRATYGRDPDGNVFEIQELMDRDDPGQLFDGGGHD